MSLRFAAFLLVSACPVVGQTTLDFSGRLNTELRQEYTYDPSAEVAPAAPVLALADDDVVQFEPFTVTAFDHFQQDITEAARSAAAAREAAKFSALRGGQILETAIGPVDLKLGIWPQLIPFTPEAPWKTGTKLSVDVIRISW
jgi:hypothetical protein